MCAFPCETKQRILEAQRRDFYSANISCNLSRILERPSHTHTPLHTAYPMVVMMSLSYLSQQEASNVLNLYYISKCTIIEIHISPISFLQNQDSSIKYSVKIIKYILYTNILERCAKKTVNLMKNKFLRKLSLKF